MTEKELAKYFLDFYINKEVFQEVPTYGGICDIMVIDGENIIAVEVKKTLSFDVMEQAERNKKFSNYSYVAVPAIKSGRLFQKKICKMLGIGILEYDPKNKIDPVEIILNAGYNNNILAPKLRDWQKLNEAGSQGERITSFSNFVTVMTTKIIEIPGISAQNLYEQLEKHYNNFSSFRSCIIEYIKSNVIKGIRYEKGKFYPL